mmetsp:Transcript_11384/g.42491  ORF Transcript_11384/g.42491 Transcript_11384/m.42491 type:complete len:380 (-) Transcript_11384:121-1260(-)
MWRAGAHLPRQLRRAFVRRISLRIFLFMEAGEQELARILSKQLPGLTVYRRTEKLPRDGVDILVAQRPKPEILRAAGSKLRAVIVPYAGIMAHTRAIFRDPEFAHLQLHNSHHNARATAEMAVTLLLAAAKGVVNGDMRLRKRDWTPRGLPVDHTPGDSVMILREKSMLVIGYGNVGKLVARSCGLGFHCKKIFATRLSISQPYVDNTSGYPVEVHPSGNLHKLLPQVSIVVLCLPDAAGMDTNHIIGEKELSLFYDNQEVTDPNNRAVFVNVARGKIVDEKALFEYAQKPGFRAAIDTWWSYPPEASDKYDHHPSDVGLPWETLTSVVLSPHRGGAIGTPDLEKERARHLCWMLQSALDGGSKWHEALPNRFHLDRGY